jgi:DNA-binding GntR family transcriptional regulator
MSDHLAIVTAVRAGDVSAAERAVRDHTARDFYRLIDARLDSLYPVDTRK